MDLVGERREQNGQDEPEKPEEPKVSPEKPCFIPSGILAKFTNTVKYISLKEYSNFVKWCGLEIY